MILTSIFRSNNTFTSCSISFMAGITGQTSRNSSCSSLTFVTQVLGVHLKTELNRTEQNRCRSVNATHGNLLKALASKFNCQVLSVACWNT